MKRFCRRSINNLVLVMVSLYPLHFTPFNETITRITQHPLLLYNSSCRSTPVKTGVLLLRQPFQLIGYTCTVAHSSPFMHTKSRCSLHFPYICVSFQDNWFSITYTQSATTRYFSCQVFKYLLASQDALEVMRVTESLSPVSPTVLM